MISTPHFKQSLPNMQMNDSKTRTVFGCNIKPMVLSDVMNRLNKLRYKNIEVSQMFLIVKRWC